MGYRDVLIKGLGYAGFLIVVLALWAGLWVGIGELL